MRVALLLLLVSTSALADDAGILRCRAIADSVARLACYDALVVPAAGAKATPAAPAAAAPQVPPAPGQPASAQPAQSPDQFGMEHRSAPVQLDAIESSIPGPFDGWDPNSRIRLANGQVWQVTDDSKAVLFLNSPKVRVRRGALGAFYLEIDGTNRSPKVKRLQ